MCLGIALTALITGCKAIEKTGPKAPASKGTPEGVASPSEQQYKWKVHDRSRPQPEIIQPPTPSTQYQTGRPPSDAIVVFDGADLSDWESGKGGPAKWTVKNDYMQVKSGTGSIQTKQHFGSCQIHIEWAAPEKVNGNGQGRGNSGVYIMGKYEVQVLDSYNNQTYPDGQAGAIYGQSPPMVNACRPPGKWQTYDIIFHRPVFKNGTAVKPAKMTVLHNGVLIQDNWELWGLSSHKKRKGYSPHPDKLPLLLQDHGDPVRYRNIWIREIPD